MAKNYNVGERSYFGKEMESLALVILLHWKVQSKTMESRTTENGDRAKPSENKMLSGSQSVLKWGTVSSFSNNKQVETGSSDKSIRFKPITIAL